MLLNKFSKKELRMFAMLGWSELLTNQITLTTI